MKFNFEENMPISIKGIMRDKDMICLYEIDINVICLYDIDINVDG